MTSELIWKAKNEHEKITVITGAGISMSSGLPGGQELNEYILSALCKDWYSGTSHLDISSSIPLETIFQALSDYRLESLIQSVIHSLDSTEISQTHRALSLDLQSGKIDNAITFNFDCLQEKSLTGTPLIETINYGKTVLKKYKGNEDTSFNLIKLHGTSEQDGIITFSEYITGFSSSVQKLLKDILKNKCILILGYGGWDYDFTQILKSLIFDGIYPKEVIWIDKYFPEKGGRTDLINLLTSAGSIVQKIEEDFENLLGLKTEESKTKTSYCLTPKSIRLLDNIPLETKKKILIQLSFQQSNVSISKDIIYQATKSNLQVNYPFFEGLLNEREGDYKNAVVRYLEVFNEASTIEQQILSAHKLFRLSDGKHRKFTEIDKNGLNQSTMNFVDFLEFSIKTDKDGLDRQLALNKIKDLPPLDSLKNELYSTDWIKILIKVYTEFARLNYESEKYKVTYEYDQYAVELARILSDPVYLKATIGNVGVSFMGIAYSSKTKLNEMENWRLAKKHLKESLTYSEYFSEFHHYLFMGNLGIVENKLGFSDAAIQLLNTAIDKLRIIYPSYSIFFFGKSASIHAKFAEEHKSTDALKTAQSYIVEGISLIKTLGDSDDLDFIIEGINDIEECSIEAVNKDFESAKLEAELIKTKKAANKVYRS